MTIEHSKHIVPTSKLYTNTLFFFPLSEWRATIEHKDILRKKDLIHHLIRKLVGRDIWNLLHVHFSRGFIFNQSIYTVIFFNLYWLKIIPLFSSTYSYPLNVQLFHFKVWGIFWLFGIFGGLVLGKREEGRRGLLQFVFSY